MNATSVTQRLKSFADPEKAEKALRFTKTGPGEYGEGDQFLGINLPTLRAEVKASKGLSVDETLILLKSPWHEIRLFAVISLAAQYKRASDDLVRERIYDEYLAHSTWVNNWDLVDSSAHLIVGPWLEDKDRSVLCKLAKAPLLWDRRIAIMATFHFIRIKQYDDTLRVAEILLPDSEDLIHKAVGWMLREVGNRDRACEEAFLKKHYTTMPRTMLRYAIEKLPEPRRKAYLTGKI